MTWRFGFMAAAGGIAIVAILAWGEPGAAALSLVALMPWVYFRAIRRRKPDERELLVFYRAGNAAMGLMFVTIVAIYFGSSIRLNGHRVGDSWHLLTIAFLMFWQGVAGTVLFLKKS